MSEAERVADSDAEHKFCERSEQNKNRMKIKCFCGGVRRMQLDTLLNSQFKRKFYKQDI